MKVEEFVRSLLPDFDKERINEDIRITHDELKNITIPAYKQADAFLGKIKLKSPKTLEKVSVFNTVIKTKKGNIVTNIHHGLQNAIVNLAEVERMIDRSYGEDIIGQGLTYFKATLLQYVEVVNFVSRYSRRLLNYIYVAETAEFDSQDDLEKALTPADLEWINANFLNFCNAFNIASKEVKELEKHLKDVPDIVITNDNVKTVSATLGENKVDPLKMGFIPVWLNPVFHVRMFIAEWQTNRYHAAKQEIKCLQLRKANLEALANGKPNAKLQKEIDYIEDRIQGYLRKNAELEKRYG